METLSTLNSTDSNVINSKFLNFKDFRFRSPPYKQINVSFGPFWPQVSGLYFTIPGAQSRFINWCYADLEQIWPGNNYKIIQKQRTNPTSECKLLLMHWIAIFWPYIFQFWKLNLTVIIGECVGISLIVLSNNNLEQFKTLKYPREREGWMTQVMWAAVSGARLLL